MDSLSHLLALLAPRCEVNLHCRFGGRWQAGHQQMRSGVVPWHVVLRGEGRLNVGGQTHHLRAGDVVLLPHGSPHLMESLVEWGQVLPVAHRFNGTVTEMRAGPAEGALEMLCGEFYFGPHVSWLFSEASTLIHLHTDAREDCPELDALLNILVRESLAQRPGGSAIVRSLLSSTARSAVLRFANRANSRGAQTFWCSASRGCSAPPRMSATPCCSMCCPSCRISC